MGIFASWPFSTLRSCLCLLSTIFACHEQMYFSGAEVHQFLIQSGLYSPQKPEELCMLRTWRFLGRVKHLMELLIPLWINQSLNFVFSRRRRWMLDGDYTELGLQQHCGHDGSCRMQRYCTWFVGCEKKSVVGFCTFSRVYQKKGFI